MKDDAPDKISFAFDGFRLSAESARLTFEDREVHLAKRPFQILLYLIENRHRVVSRDELLDRFWDGRDVYDDALRKAVGAIRKALNDLEKPPRFIETRYGSGFRFIGNLAETRVLPKKSNDLDHEFSPFERANPRYVLLVTLAICSVSLVVLGFFAFRQRGENISSVPLEKIGVRRSIAVLPLKNLTGEAANDYLSDGITESIITELSRLNELKIISRSSIFTYKNKEINPPEIGRQLAVDSFLEGSLQKNGASLSVNVRLVSAKDGQILWTSQNFERPLSAAYELQTVISCNVADELGAKLCGALPPPRGTSSTDAYQAYLKGRYHWNKRTAEGIKKSIEFYEEALKFDANYAAAYAGLAESYAQGIWHVPFPAREVLPKAKNAALKALELDAALAEASAALAKVYELEWKWANAEREIARAVELNPRSARVHHVQAFCFLILGRREEAVAAIERARELDPLNLVINTDKAMILFVANRDEEAFRQWEKTLELDPNFIMAREHRAGAYEIVGNDAAAIEENAKVMELRGQSPEQIAAYRQTASKYGLKEVYRKKLNDALAKEAGGEDVSSVYVAAFYAALGDKEEAFKRLEKAYKERSAEMVIALTSRQFDPLRADSRFSDLLRRVNVAQ